VTQLELKVPPLIVVVATAALMWLASLLLPQARIAIEHRGSIAAFIAGVGFVIVAAGIVPFMRARTTVDPTRPQGASSLVTGGVYRLTRNPMYLGMLLALLGWAVFLANGPALIFLPAFVLYLTEFQIKPEERALAARFGADYAAYRTRVRRWV
jgi:protein-S-isoprenylcysteine O-methyltransferase Ste14